MLQRSTGQINDDGHPRLNQFNTVLLKTTQYSDSFFLTLLLLEGFCKIPDVRYSNRSWREPHYFSKERYWSRLLSQSQENAKAKGICDKTEKRNREMKFRVWIIEVCISFKHRWESTYTAELKSANAPAGFYCFFSSVCYSYAAAQRLIKSKFRHDLRAAGFRWARQLKAFISEAFCWIPESVAFTRCHVETNGVMLGMWSPWWPPHSWRGGFSASIVCLDLKSVHRQLKRVWHISLSCARSKPC